MFIFTVICVLLNRTARTAIFLIVKMLKRPFCCNSHFSHLGAAEYENYNKGRSGKNRILIPLILPLVSDFEVLCSVVTLALSLVLYVSRYKATIHLAVRLGWSEKNSALSEHDLNQQHSYTVDETAMTSSVDMLDRTSLSRRFKGSVWLDSRSCQSQCLLCMIE